MLSADNGNFPLLQQELDELGENNQIKLVIMTVHVHSSL